MASAKKARLNLYINRELLDFAKKWSYVLDEPISGMLEEFLLEQQGRIKGISPFQWLNERGDSSSSPAEEQSRAELEAYLYNPEEEEFCRQNPDHPRAVIRRKLMAEYEQTQSREMEGRKAKDREFISRWLQVFPVK